MNATGAVPSPDQIQELEKAFQQFVQVQVDARIVSYAVVASFMALLYDIVLTFPIEWEFVWKARMTKGSLMYFIMRYGNVVEQGITLAFNLWPGAPFTFCKVWFYIDEWVAYALFIPTTIILGLRTYALYRDQGPFYKWLIVFVIGGLNCVMFVSLGLVTKEIQFSPPPVPGLTCTFSFQSSPYTAGLIQFIATVVYDVCLFSLTAYRVYKYYREGNRRITRVVLQSAFLYTSVLSCGGLATLVLYTGIAPSRVTLRGLLVGPMKAMAVIIASHLILDLRKYVLNPEAVTIDTLTASPRAYRDDPSSSGLSDMAFRTRTARSADELY